MRKQKIEELIRLVEASEINELEVWEGKTKVRISKSLSAQPASNPEVQQLHTVGEPVETVQAANSPESGELASNLKEIISPMVGTFYRAPAPDAEPFVEAGQTVTVGQTVCIVEAMKLMNEIGSDYHGIIRKIFIDNAQPVEYGQPLFAIEIT